MKTSETALELGLYLSDCCGEELIFDIGDNFCRCPKCHGACKWALIEPLVAFDELDTMSENRAA